MNARILFRRAVTALFVGGALAVGPAVPTIAHGPDPAIGWPLFDQNQALTFQWKSGEVPPSKMQIPILNGADDATESKASKAPSIAYDADGDSTVEYGLNVFCGAGGLACADGWDAPDSFKVAFREHGHVFDWGTLKWCQMLTNIADGCYDVENITLDELGHVMGLDHHTNFTDQRDYRDAVVQTVSRARPKDGYNAHAFGVCDVAKLQLRYDAVNSSKKLSTCLDLTTVLKLTVSDTSIRPLDRVTFTAVLRVGDIVKYEQLRSNALSNRVVVLQRRPPGTTAWSNVAVMPATAASATYALNASPSATYEWRALFSTPSDEGLHGIVSTGVTVIVSGTCSTSPCPQVAPLAAYEQTGR
jgi:hypothetical protein